jgi:tight adherence protein C
METMLVVNHIFLLCMTAAMLLSRGKIKQIGETVDKKEHRLYFLYPVAEFIRKRTGIKERFRAKTRISQSMKELNTTSKSEIWEQLYWDGKISAVILILYLFSLFVFFIQLQKAWDPLLINGRYLIRPGYGKGSKQVDLKVSMDRVGKKIKNGDKQKRYVEDIAIELYERSYEEEEIDRVFEEAYVYLKIIVLGENKSKEYIYKNLNFVKQIPETSIKVNWEVEDDTLIAQDGTVNNQKIKRAGRDITVTAILSYRDKRMNYPMKFHVMPRQCGKKELLLQRLKETIHTSSEKSSGNRRMKLPDMLGDYRLTWEDTGNDTGTRLMIMGILVAVLVWFYIDKQLQAKLERRKKQMLFDYPDIIHKFTLLVNAGMTVKQAWIRIAQDYKEKNDSCDKMKRYAYEEMLITVHELRLGISESKVYEDFGKRSGQLIYMKFCSLIIQNLKKGNKGLTELLGKEAAEAFENRKDNAKRLGEEAGTKLLMPMLMMLIAVFLIILIPVFLSIQV